MKAKFFLAIALLFGVAINSASAQSYGKDRRGNRDRVENGRGGDFQRNDEFSRNDRNGYDRAPKHFRKQHRERRFYGHGRHYDRHDRHASRYYSYHNKRSHRFN